MRLRYTLAWAACSGGAPLSDSGDITVGTGDMRTGDDGCTCCTWGLAAHRTPLTSLASLCRAGAWRLVCTFKLDRGASLGRGDADRDGGATAVGGALLSAPGIAAVAAGSADTLATLVAGFEGPKAATDVDDADDAVVGADGVADRRRWRRRRRRRALGGLSVSSGGGPIAAAFLSSTWARTLGSEWAVQNARDPDGYLRGNHHARANPRISSMRTGAVLGLARAGNSR